jgi:hypothetical protein
LLSLLPSALLLLAALAILILQRLRPSLGYAWIIATLTSLVALGVTTFLRWRLPQQVVLKNWLPFSVFTDSPIFGLDGDSWPYLFAIAAVALAVFLTASARLEPNVSPYAWAGILGLCAAGNLAVLSGNLLTLTLTWTLIDLLELVILLSTSSNRTLGVQTVTMFAIRVTGTVLVIVAALYSRGQNLPPTFATLPSTSALLLLLAAGLRLGVLPIHLPNIQGIIRRRGLGTTLRMVSAASALVVLARLPAESVSSDMRGPLLAFTALAAVYGAAMWANAADEVEGRPYWLIALGGLAVASVIQGQPGASLAWGLMLILPGSLLFLYSVRRRQILLLLVPAIIGITGIPFTPASSGWFGIFPPPFNLWQFLLLIAHALVFLGYLKFVFLPGDDLAKMERWIQAMYPAGLAVLVLAWIFTGLLGWPGSLGPGLWLAGPASLVISALFWLIIILWQRRTTQDDAISRWYSSATHTAGSILTSLFSLNWLYRLLWAVYRRVQQVIQVLTEILEGDGGVLWTLVLLALLISLLQSRLAR